MVNVISVWNVIVDIWDFPLKVGLKIPCLCLVTVDDGEDTNSDVEEYSGMEQPPLIKHLKTILAEYPDDGQIIKVCTFSDS